MQYSLKSNARTLIVRKTSPSAAAMRWLAAGGALTRDCIPFTTKYHLWPMPPQHQIFLVMLCKHSKTKKRGSKIVLIST